MGRSSLLLACALGLILMMAGACGGGNGEPAATSTLKPTATPTSAIIETPTPSDGLVARGRELYLNVPDNAAPQALWCYQCHFIESVAGAAGLIGPEHSHLATVADTRKPGLSAEEYIRESIKNPALFVAEGVERSTPGLMTNAITEKLTEDQIEALVAFLMTLK